MIVGSGPRPAEIAVLVDAPGKEDVKANRPLFGPGGKITFAFLGHIMGLRREQVYVDNLLQEPLTDAQEKRGLDALEMAIAGGRLEADLEAVQPLFILSMGKHVTAHLLEQDPEDTDMESLHGLVFERNGRYIVPAFNPAAGLKDSKRLAYSMNDFKAFAALVAGKAPVWEPRTAPRTYAQAAAADIQRGMWGEVAIDTEYDNEGIIMLTFSSEVNTGYAIYKDQVGLLLELRSKLLKDRPIVILHNALADLEPLRTVGLDLVGMGLTIRDTMIRAWYRETDGQGLKRLAYRLLGTDREDFEQTVRPYFESQLVSYLEAARALVPRGEIVKIGKKGKPLKPKPAPMTPLQKKLSRFLADYEAGRIKDMLKRWSGWEEEREEVEQLLGRAPEFTVRHIPPAVVIPYAASDTDDTLGIFRAMKPYSAELERMDNEKLPLVAEMQARGMLVDMDRRNTLHAELEAELESRLSTLRALTEWEDFNPKSSDDVAEALYGFRKIAPGVGQFMKDREYLNPPNFTKAGKPKTDKKALGQLRGESPVISELLVYKELDKLQNTYVGPMPKYLRDGVMHPSFTHTRIPSGRLASRRPNMMAIPSRTDWGKRVRGLFVARPGFRFVSFDHSQIEITVAAQVSKDRTLLDALQAGTDVHATTAHGLMGGAPATDPYWKTDAEGKVVRQISKMLNFLMLFGGTSERFYLELLAAGISKFTLEDAQEFHAGWLQLYSGIAAAIRRTEKFVQQYGYAQDMWGRRRQLPGAHLYGKFWPMSALREEAVRQGFSQEIQGGAQGLIIRAMIRAREVLDIVRKMGILVWPVLQIHDELVFEIEDDAEKVEVFKALMLDAMMADQALFSVPIESTSSDALDWGGLK